MTDATDALAASLAQISVDPSGRIGTYRPFRAHRNAVSAQHALAWGSRDLDSRIDAVLITHEHGDHVAHASRVSRVFEAPVHVNEKTRAAAGRHLDRVVDPVSIESERPFSVGALRIHPVAKPHDAADPVSFLISCGEHTLGVITDQGEIDSRTRAAMSSFPTCETPATAAIQGWHASSSRIFAPRPWPATKRRRWSTQSVSPA